MEKADIAYRRFDRIDLKKESISGVRIYSDINYMIKFIKSLDILEHMQKVEASNREVLKGRRIGSSVMNPILPHQNSFLVSSNGTEIRCPSAKSVNRCDRSQKMLKRPNSCDLVVSYPDCATRSQSYTIRDSAEVIRMNTDRHPINPFVRFEQLEDSTVNRIYRLSELEEVLGDLHSVEVTDIGLIAIIGKISVWLPEDLEERLNGWIGQRVSVLRLDGYHLRCLGEEDSR